MNHNSDSTGVWQDCVDPVTVGVNDVENFLFAKTKEEVTLVNARLLKKMRLVFGKSLLAEDVKNIHLAAVWLPPIMNIISRRVNKHRTRDSRIRKDEILGFLADEMYMCFYGKSPEIYFNTDPRPRFLKPPAGLSKTRYFDVLRALSSKPSSTEFQEGDEEFLGSIFENHWEQPLAPNADLSATQKELRIFCAEIGFVKDVSILGIDDDLL